MGRQDVTRTVADQLTLAERFLRDRREVVAVTVLVSMASIVVHALLGTSEMVWVTLVALSAMALSRGEPALVLAIVTGIGHAAAGAFATGVLWFGSPLVHVAGFVAVVALASGTGVLLRRHEEARRRSLDEDAVTGLLNVRAFYEGLAVMAGGGRPYAILLADIAGMRGLNERYGHPTGTEAMRALGHVLRRSTKRSDLVARLGSDEVAVALVGADREGALAAAQRLAARLAEERLTLPDGTAFRVHAHYGIAASADMPADEVTLLRAADHAKLAAKLAGLDEIGVAADASDEHFEIVHPRSPAA